MNSYVLSVRLNDEQKQQLHDLAAALGMSEADAVRHSIKCAWMAYDDLKPEAKKALDRLQVLARQMEQLRFEI